MYIAAAARFGLTACTEDYKDWVPQQQPTQPATVSFGDGSVTEMGVIDLNNLAEGQETVKVASIVAPTASAEGYEPTYTITLGDVTYPIEADGLMSVSELQAYVSEVYGRRPTERDITATISMWIGNGATTVKTATSAPFKVKIIPEAPQISDNYYIVGGPNDWAGSAASKALKFNHSEADVYEDPVFPVVFDANEGDTWFAIGDDAACDAIANDGNWSLLLGTMAGNGNSGTEGMLNFRYNLSDDGSFMVPAGAKKIRVTINMMEYSYKVETVNISDNYYLVGGTLEWAESARTKAQKFSHSDADVFSDPYFTIIVPANAGGDTWFAIGDDAACDAIANDNNWSLLYGTTAGNGLNGPTGNLAPRSQIPDGEGSLKYHTDAAMIKVVINMLDLTFEISDVAPQYFMVGALPGWNAEGAQTALFYPTSASTMTYTSVFPEGSNLKIWNKNDLGDWSKCYGSVVDNATDASGALVSTGAGAISVPGAGVYTLALDLGTMQYTWTKLDNQSPKEYTTIGVVGGFCNWANDGATDLDMKQVTPHNWYVVTEFAESTELKFRANDAWDVNWGVDMTIDEGAFYGVAEQDKPNIKVSAGKYAFYFNDITGQFAIVAQ